MSGEALPGGDGAVGAERRLEPGELLGGRAGADALVAVEVDAGDGRRRGRRRSPALQAASASCVRAGGELVLALAGDRRAARASCSLASPSETVHSSGIRSLTSRQPSVVETAVTLPAGNARDGLGSTHGARVIDSTPPARTTSASPVSMVREPAIAASSEEPHRRFTVVAGTVVGSPASSTAIRPTLRLSSPAWLAQPHTTSPMLPGSSPGALASTPVDARSPPGRRGAPRRARRRSGRRGCGRRRTGRRSSRSRA